MGLVLDGGGFLSNNDPLDGPGPPGPAVCGTPVSATVGVTDKTFVDGSAGLGATTGEVGWLYVGICAGAWLRFAGFSGGDMFMGEGAVAALGGLLLCGCGEGIDTGLLSDDGDVTGCGNEGDELG